MNGKWLMVNCEWRMIVFVVIWVLFGVNGWAQEVGVEWVVDDGIVTVGDVVTGTLRVGHPAGWRVIQPEMRDESGEWGEWEVVSVGNVTISADGAREVSEVDVVVRGWRPGVVSGVELLGEISMPDGTLQTVQIAPFEVEIVSVLNDEETELRDIKPQAVMEIVGSNRFWLGVGIGVLALAAVVGILISARRRRPGVFVTQSPYEVAMAELDEIRARGGELGVRAYYANVADVVRRYVERTSGIVATKRTSSELDSALERANFGGRERLRPLLREADLVKFAKVEPTGQSAGAFVEAAERFVYEIESEIGGADEE